jgi:hypothetical protein
VLAPDLGTGDSLAAAAGVGRVGAGVYGSPACPLWPLLCLWRSPSSLRRLSSPPTCGGDADGAGDGDSESLGQALPVTNPIGP